MNRRNFLASSLAASSLAVSASGAEDGGREYYELRRYELLNGPQHQLTDSYLKEALVPGLNRLGIRPVGVFHATIGPHNSSLYVLIPSASPDLLVNSEFHLSGDAEYRKAGRAFLEAPPERPPFLRVESSLMRAFEGWPKLTVPPATAGHRPRVFELRTYESPSVRDHQRKVEMFNSGEYAAFEAAGFWRIFYGDTLIGSRLPNLTYMIGFPSLAERDKMWAAFSSGPGWKKLAAEPRFSFEQIVSDIANAILSPTEYSQI